MISLSVSEASRHFPELVRRICARDEEALLSENGKPVARLIPVTEVPVTGRKLAEIWPSMTHLEPDEAAAFDTELASVRNLLPLPKPKWD